MRKLLLIALVTIFGACATTESGSNSERSSGSERGAGRNGARPKASGGEPSKLAIDPKEVPTAVRAIESVIDKQAVLLAEEVEIYVSKNYQHDVSLTGDAVSQDRDGSGGIERQAFGRSTSFVRNLEIRADRSVRARIADVGTEPFIRILARGHCAYIPKDGGATPVERSTVVYVRNEDIEFHEQVPARVVAEWGPKRLQ